MRKAEQTKINRKVEEVERSIALEKCWGQPATQLNKCNAWIYHAENGAQILRSYNTVVAVILDGVCYDFLRMVYGYTPTSAKQISKFASQYGAREVLTWREV